LRFDPRVTLARTDLAASGLQGVVRAARFVAPRPMTVSSPSAWMWQTPERSAEHVNQLLFGELFDALETHGEFVWGQARRDGYVGFVETGVLHAVSPAATHWVAVRSTFAFSEPAVRAPPFGPLSMNALVAVEESQGAFLRAQGAGWIAASHLRPIGSFATDPAGVAEQFLGAPYLWGGRDAAGLDCSGLIQLAFQACGKAAPRDADQQAALGFEIDPKDLRRGDLVAWRGHVGIMLDEARLLHANAHHMAVAVERLAEGMERIALAGHGQPTAYRRVPLV
jgi:cell wall-associated NlpC family hydrolase